MSGYKEEKVFRFDGLIGGSEPALLEKIVALAKGQGVLKRGSVLGITAENKAKLVDSAATDGSEKALYILVGDTDTKEETNAPAYMAGMFNREYLIFGGSDKAEQHEDNLREGGIYLTSEKYFEGDK